MLTISNSATETGVKREQIGTVQMWHYPADQVAEIREAYLREAFRDRDLVTDENMRRLWIGIEDYLLTQFPDVDNQAFLVSTNRLRKRHTENISRNHPHV